jgi:LeuA allosteric (dimerisation) domain
MQPSILPSIYYETTSHSSFVFLEHQTYSKRHTSDTGFISNIFSLIKSELYSYKLLAFKIESQGYGIDAIAKASIIIEYNGRVCMGEAESTDTLIAPVLALYEAISNGQKRDFVSFTENKEKPVLLEINRIQREDQNNRFILSEYQIQCLQDFAPSVQITLLDQTDNTLKHRSVLYKTGPLDCVFSGINEIAGCQAKLIGLSIRAHDSKEKEQNAHAFATVEIWSKKTNKKIAGFGYDINTCTAAIKAYLQAINKILPSENSYHSLSWS